jgi:PTH2 family peptidyl-tRNA hydrolase
MSERIVIYANSNVSRGKFAAAAVHAALTAAGVHPGLPVIVLGAKPSEIQGHDTVIRDAGRTEVEPGTVTAGTDWSHKPTEQSVRLPGGSLFGAILAGQERLRERRHESADESNFQDDDRHRRAVAIFERRMGFTFTDEYEQSREWSDALAEATEPTDPCPVCSGVLVHMLDCPNRLAGHESTE